MVGRVVLVAVMALGVSACSGSSVPTRSLPTDQGGGGSATGADSLQSAMVNVVAKVRPEVVEITTNSGLGSGVVYDSRGDIVTNAHVVAGATHLQVTLSTGQSLPATLVGSFTPDDVAVVRISGADKLVPATLADSKKLQVGEICLAVGNPLGLASSVTEGIVSFVGRTVAEGGGVVLPDTVQTSAAINPGNSGGALVDLDGKLIGIPTLAAADPRLGGGAASGIGFAIPSNTVKFIADQLIAGGRVSNTGRAALGITATTGYGAGGRPTGVVIVGVQPGGPADKADIRAGYTITAVGTEATPTLAALQSALAELAPGTTTKVTFVAPGGTPQTVTLTLEELPAQTGG